MKPVGGVRMDICKRLSNWGQKTGNIYLWHLTKKSITTGELSEKREISILGVERMGTWFSLVGHGVLLIAIRKVRFTVCRRLERVTCISRWARGHRCIM